MSAESATVSTTVPTGRNRGRPVMNKETAILLVRELYGLRVKEIRELDAYDDKNYHVICEDRHTNPHLEKIATSGYVLKVINSLDSRDTAFVDAQNEMMLHLEQRNVTCPLPVKNLEGSLYASRKLGPESDETHVVRLLVYRPGSTVHAVPMTLELLRDVGCFAARLGSALADFSHPGFKNRSASLWTLTAIPRLREFVFAVDRVDDRKLVLEVVEFFEKRFREGDRPKEGIIHGDLNEHNLLVDPRGTNIAAVIDFGDAHRGCLLFELAIAVCYMIIETRDPSMARPVIEGFRTVRKLEKREKELLKISVCARLSQSLVLGAYSYLNDPGNQYLLTTQEFGWPVLRELWPLEEARVRAMWGLDDDDDDPDPN